MLQEIWGRERNVEAKEGAFGGRVVVKMGKNQKAGKDQAMRGEGERTEDTIRQRVCFHAETGLVLLSIDELDRRKQNTERLLQEALPGLHSLPLAELFASGGLDGLETCSILGLTCAP